MGDDNETRAFLAGDMEAIGRVRAAIGYELSRRRLEFAQRQDLEQEALVRVLAGLRRDRFRGESSLATYARRVARYTYLETVRARRAISAVDPDEIPSTDRGSSPDDALLREEERVLRVRALAELSPECRELFSMILVDKLPYDTVARHYGLESVTVRTRLHRCREKVHATMRRVVRLGSRLRGDRMEPGP